MADETFPAGTRMRQHAGQVIPVKPVENEHNHNHRKHPPHGAACRFQQQHHHDGAHHHIGSIGHADAEGEFIENDRQIKTGSGNQHRESPIIKRDTADQRAKIALGWKHQENQAKHGSDMDRLMPMFGQDAETSRIVVKKRKRHQQRRHQPGGKAR